ncbi:MAG TPA: MerR family transcriptional regulator [Longimicrobiales bacterium]|nr:MerR family transcriptional regulator [Longimicrobiales bacterium]
MDTKTYTVSQVSRMAQVTVRTLHHYDEIGLLVPTQRSASSYRQYTEQDLQRLQQILVFRELGFALDAVAALLEQSAEERRAALLMQRERLQADLSKTNAVIRAIETAIRTIDGGTAMSNDDIFKGMENFEHKEYAEEARERWGHTEAYQESARRAKQYSKADWSRIKEESDAITRGLAEAMLAGKPADGPDATALAEQHRLHIGRWFYSCSHEMHLALGAMYVTDARFTETYERMGKGLARYVRDAIAANAAGSI